MIQASYVTEYSSSGRDYIASPSTYVTNFSDHAPIWHPLLLVERHGLIAPQSPALEIERAASTKPPRFHCSPSSHSPHRMP
jgi:hypothetical protein